MKILCEKLNEEHPLSRFHSNMRFDTMKYIYSRGDILDVPMPRINLNFYLEITQGLYQIFFQR